MPWFAYHHSAFCCLALLFLALLVCELCFLFSLLYTARCMLRHFRMQSYVIYVGGHHKHWGCSSCSGACHSRIRTCGVCSRCWWITQTSWCLKTFLHAYHLQRHMWNHHNIHSSYLPSCKLCMCLWQQILVWCKRRAKCKVSSENYQHCFLTCYWRQLLKNQPNPDSLMCRSALWCPSACPYKTSWESGWDWGLVCNHK